MVVVALPVLFFAFGAYVSKDVGSSTGTVDQVEREQAERRLAEVAAREKLAEELRMNRANIIATVRELIAKGEYAPARSQANRFRSLDDSELRSLSEEATQKYGLKREKDLLSQLRKGKKSDFESAVSSYQELASLFPNNPIYKTSLQRAQGELAVKKARDHDEEQRRLALFGEPPKQRSWDGSYASVESYLRRVLNDPDSLQMNGCTGVFHIDSGWLVGCDYRGKNGFGGLVRQSNWFTIRHEQVVTMQEATAYQR